MGKQVTIYLKDADIAKYDAIKNKARWFRYALATVNEQGIEMLEDIDRRVAATPLHVKSTKTVEAKRPLTSQEIQPAAKVKHSPGMFDRDIQFCKHGNVKGTCKKGCK